MAIQLRHLNPKTIAAPPGYTHVVEATGPGRIVYIAGQLGMDVGGKLVGQSGDFRAQAMQVYENLKTALAEVGATFKDVVKTTNYLIDLKHLPLLREARGIYLAGPNPPASTTVQISGLAREGALLEIEAIAILPARPEKTAVPAKASSKRKVTAKPKKTAARKAAPKKKRNRK
jgi:enamine deaminase RidA (YjgF/YER057c/UK114 family)